MKNFLFLLMSFLCIGIFTSCDKNKKEVEKQTKVFISAINDKDKATITDIYAASANFKSMTSFTDIKEGDLTIEAIDSVTYEVKIDNTRLQKLIFKMNGKTAKIVDTYGVFELDSALTEIALKTGVPLKELSDTTQNWLMDTEGEYITYLVNNHPEIQPGLVDQGWSWVGSWQNGITFTITIRNQGETAIKGENYTSEITIWTPDDNLQNKMITEYGVDLEPGESYQYTIYHTGTPWSIYNKTISASVEFKYKKLDIKEMFTNANLKNDEYSKYKEQEKNKTKKQQADKKV